MTNLGNASLEIHHQSRQSVYDVQHQGDVRLPGCENIRGLARDLKVPRVRISGEVVAARSAACEHIVETYAATSADGRHLGVVRQSETNEENCSWKRRGAGRV